MENRRSYNLNDVLAKGKCITDFFSNNAGSGGNCITHCWMLILMTGISGATAGAAALWVDGSVGCLDVGAERRV